jgi:hypothetical protein
VAIKVAIHDIPPLIQSASRFAIATLLVSGWCHARGQPLFKRDGTLVAGIFVGVLFALEFLLIYRGLVWTTVTRADRAAHGLPFDAAESVIDVIRRTDEADVAVVLKEDDDGCWQVSARSKGAADVGRACVALGGGGHQLAAGFTARGPADGVIAALCGELAAGPAAAGGR